MRVVRELKNEFNLVAAIEGEAHIFQSLKCREILFSD
jgi:hypothetical protein